MEQLVNYNKKVNSDKLTQEITSNAGITKALAEVAMNGEEPDIVTTLRFREELPEEQLTILDGIVAAHDSTATAAVDVIPVDDGKQKDAEDAAITRLKYAPLGWTYQSHCIEATTAKLNSLSNINVDGTDLGFASIKFYNDSNVELTDQETIDSSCVKTVVQWEATHDMELISGDIRIHNEISENVRLWVIAAPHIPAPYGSKVFIQGMNLKFISAKTPIETDGRASKFIPYNSTDHRGRIHFVFRHPAGVKVESMITLEMFKA